MPVADGFLNVDLEIGARTRSRIEPLIAAFEDTLFELFCGRLQGLYRAHYETKGCTRDANATIHELASVIEALKGPERRAWDGALVRDFNVGVELARGVRSIELAVDPEALERIVALGGRIAFTAYQAAAIPRAKRQHVGAVAAAPGASPRRR
jgi:hypothetical protein